MENKITLVIPAKNEADSLPKVLKELKKFKFKISIVLERSDQKTIESIKKFMLFSSFLTVVITETSFFIGTYYQNTF